VSLRGASMTGLAGRRHSRLETNVGASRFGKSSAPTLPYHRSSDGGADIRSRRIDQQSVLCLIRLRGDVVTRSWTVIKWLLVLATRPWGHRMRRVHELAVVDASQMSPSSVTTALGRSCLLGEREMSEPDYLQPKYVRCRQPHLWQYRI
jgi:hypothetical protein